jgi:hypothetical protein
MGSSRLTRVAAATGVAVAVAFGAELVADHAWNDYPDGSRHITFVLWVEGH